MKKIKRFFFVPFSFLRLIFFSITPFVLQTTAWPIMRLALYFCCRVKVLGKENLCGHREGRIFASNHISELDPIVIPTTLNPFSSLMPMFYISREREFYEKSGITKFLYGGLFFKIWGAYQAFVGLKDFERGLHHHIDILESGHSVCLFPQGGITKDGNIGEGKLGVAYLLWRTGKSVIPVAIYGLYRATFYELRTRKRSVIVSYGKPITREELFGSNIGAEAPSREELRAATEIIMQRIREMHELLV